MNTEKVPEINQRFLNRCAVEDGKVRIDEGFAKSKLEP